MALVGHVYVPHGGFESGMAYGVLHSAEIDAGFESMGSIAVA